MDLLTRQDTKRATTSSRTDQPIAKRALHSTHTLQVAYLEPQTWKWPRDAIRTGCGASCCRHPKCHCPSVLLFLKRSSAPNCSPPAPYTASCTPHFHYQSTLSLGCLLALTGRRNCKVPEPFSPSRLISSISTTTWRFCWNCKEQK